MCLCSFVLCFSPSLKYCILPLTMNILLHRTFLNLKYLLNGRFFFFLLTTAITNMGRWLYLLLLLKLTNTSIFSYLNFANLYSLYWNFPCPVFALGWILFLNIRTKRDQRKRRKHTVSKISPNHFTEKL